MYEEDRENREDRDQEIERTEIMDDVDEQETQTSSSRSQENGKSGSSQNVNWTTPKRSSERTSSERKTQWQESRQQNNRPEHGYRNEYRETVQAPRKKNSWARKAAGITAAAVLFGTVAGGVMTGVNYVGARLTGLADITAAAPAETEGTTTAQVPETSAASNNGSTTAVSTVTDVSSIAEKAMPSLVAINDTMTVEQNNFFGMPQTYQAQSSGSGIIVGQNDTELLIATNNHVVKDANSLTVCFTDQDGNAVTAKDLENTSAESNSQSSDSSTELENGTAVEAQIKGTDSDNDLAVISVKLSDIPEDVLSQIKVATLGDSDSLTVGEQVVAIGNALGYGQSVTSGYVSALNKKVSSENANSTFIQTDAAINPGNSGGALLNMKGELIGINSAKIASDEVEGMGFAIPISKAEPILDNLMSKKTREKVEDENKAAYLGITCKNVTSEASEMYNMPVGVFVDSVVENGPAEEAGLKAGDIIRKIDGTSVETYDNLVSQLEYYEAGEKIEFEISRADGGEYKDQTVTVTLGAKKDAQTSTDNNGRTGNN